MPKEMEPERKEARKEALRVLLNLVRKNRNEALKKKAKAKPPKRKDEEEEEESEETEEGAEALGSPA